MADLPIELRGVAETLEDADGVWRSCSGCYETEDGYPVGRYPYSEALRCQLGSGCGECGGIGAVWDNMDYSGLADFMEEQDRAVRDGEAEFASWLPVPAGVSVSPQQTFSQQTPTD